MSDEQEEYYTMVFERSESEMGSIYSKIYCSDVRTRDNILLQEHICLETILSKKAIFYLSVGELLFFNAKLVFEQVEFLYTHEYIKVYNDE